ncbi:MAG: YfhO family protein [Ruminococcus sp.]|nr:YfhO family protein [Ruminococcus sp.]
MTLKNAVQNKKNYTLRAFLYGLTLAVLIVVPLIVASKGYFLYYGDFNVQQIPFYTLAHDAIRSGNTSWSHITDLGANFVGSYTFYLLSSPFFLATLPFPTHVVPYLMGPLLILKLGLCSMTAYIYLRRYVYDKRYAVIGGLLYAFSSYSIYNIFFFHFHEAIIVFPLLLSAVDEFMYTKRKGVLCLAVFASCFINYYFFFSMVVFVIIYYFVKLISKAYKFELKYFLLMAFECILGVCMACAVLVPSLYAIINNSRVSEILTGYDALLYDVPQRYMHIFESMFFPPDIPAGANFAPDSYSNWASIAVWLPLFSMTFVIGYLQSYQKSWLKRMIIVLFIMAGIPILNAAFQAFNEGYYARWFFMLTLMMILCTIISLENIRSHDATRPFKWTYGLTLAIALSIGFMIKEKYDVGDVTFYSFGLEEYPLRFWIYVAISLISLTALFFIVKYTRHKKELFLRLISIALCVVIVGYSEYLLFLGKSETDHSDEFTIKYALNFGEDITLEDVKDVRSDFYYTMDNIGMYWQIPNIQGFHSIVPASTMDFYNTIGSVRDVASRPEPEYYGVRGLLSVKYLFDARDDGADFVDVVTGVMKMQGFKYIDTQNGYDVYENEHYVPMGFMYDQFICEEEFKNLSNGVKHLALMKAMVLSQQQMKEYSDITGYVDGMYMGLNSNYSEDKLQNQAYPKYDDFDSITMGFEYSQQDYYDDCENRKKTACDSFYYTKDGFKATVTNNGDDNLLFFSVPYDEGFSAYVNGKPAKIEKANIGFMAVKVDGHKTSQVEFVYTTPGLKAGTIITCFSFLVFAVYMVITKGFKCKKKYRRLYKIKKS